MNITNMPVQYTKKTAMGETASWHSDRFNFGARNFLPRHLGIKPEHRHQYPASTMAGSKMRDSIKPEHRHQYPVA